MSSACEVCGDKGFFEALIYCEDCHNQAIHQYCLHVLPASFHEHATWFCGDCEPQEVSTKPSTFDEPTTAILPKEKNNFLAHLIQGCPIWKGFGTVTNPVSQNKVLAFEECVKKKQPERFAVGLIAYLSSLSCSKATNDKVNLLPNVLSPKLSPRSKLMPKSFRHRKLNGDDIDLFFFLHKDKDDNVFDGLVRDMIHRDLAMKVTVKKNLELLVFTSVILPTECWRLQGKLFLWGSFKWKK